MSDGTAEPKDVEPTWEDEVADLIALKVIQRLMAVTSFPTAEDVERIRDHVSPTGVAYQNGFKAGRSTERCDVLNFTRELGPMLSLDHLLEAIEHGDHESE